MGQDQSTILNSAKANKDLAPGSSKKIIVVTDSEKLVIKVKDPNLTCGWLLSEANRLSNSTKHICALKSSSGLETIDHWLNLYDKKLIPILDCEKLVAYYSDSCKYEVNLEDFKPIKMIGEGGFSVVTQVMKIDTGELFAVKSMDKSFLIRQDKLNQALTERKVMSKLSHPFIVKLHWAFQSPSKLHLVMDFCPGGELFYHLHNLGRLTERQAKFYFAEILLALEYLHSHSIIYRDLKPENVLLDLDGHIKITDFGLSKEGVAYNTITNTFCGSPEYMSPEMLEGSGHGRMVDLYSLGAILFELLTGFPPFYESNRSKMYFRIKQEELKLPSYLTKRCRNLLLSLLDKNPHKRLGASFGFQEVKLHPWCRKIDWEKVLSKKAVPPFRPNMRKSNFDPEYFKKDVSEVFSSKGEEPYIDDWEVVEEASTKANSAEMSPVLCLRSLEFKSPRKPPPLLSFSETKPVSPRT